MKAARTMRMPTGEAFSSPGKAARALLAAGWGTSRTEEQGAKRIGSRSRRTGTGARRMTLILSSYIPNFY